MRERAEHSAPLGDPQVVAFPVDADVSSAQSASDPGTRLTDSDEHFDADLHEAARKLSESITADLANWPRRASRKRRGFRKSQDEPVDTP